LQIMNNEFGGGSIYHRSVMPSSGVASAVGDAGGDSNCTKRLNQSAANRDCQGLQEVESALTEAACAAACCADQDCSVWQVREPR
jgi:hypothetical protein